MSVRIDELTAERMVRLRENIEKAKKDLDIRREADLLVDCANWAENIAVRGSVRTKVIFSILFPRYMPVMIESIIGSNDEVYLPMFLRLSAKQLLPVDLHQALSRLARQCGAEGLFNCFVELPRETQRECALYVGRLMHGLQELYWSRRYWHYVMKVLGFYDSSLERMMHECLTSEPDLKTWSSWETREAVELLKKTRGARFIDEETCRPVGIVLKRVYSGVSPEQTEASLVLPDEGSARAHYVVLADGWVRQLMSLNRACSYQLSDKPEDDNCVCFTDLSVLHLVNQQVLVVAYEVGADNQWPVGDAQYKALRGLLARLCRENGIPFERAYIAGEEQLCPLLYPRYPEMPLEKLLI